MRRDLAEIEEAERQKRRAETVRELSAVCSGYGARCAYDPAIGIEITDGRFGASPIRWRWPLVSHRCEVIVPPCEYPGPQADALRWLAEMVGSTAFGSALGIALTRMGDAMARAIAEATETRERQAAPVHYKGD